MVGTELNVQLTMRAYWVQSSAAQCDAVICALAVECCEHTQAAGLNACVRQTSCIQICLADLTSVFLMRLFGSRFLQTFLWRQELLAVDQCFQRIWNSNICTRCVLAENLTVLSWAYTHQAYTNQATWLIITTLYEYSPERPSHIPGGFCARSGKCCKQAGGSI